MKFARRHRVKEGVNLTPLIDVVFLLLIFFMVTTTFKEDSEFSLELPQASNEVERIDVDLTVTIQSNGSLFLNGRSVNGGSEQLARAIESLNLDGEVVVTIEADKDATHQMVIDVLDALAQNGFNQVSIATTVSN
ncbi:MAG: biopolymer transporter ExbD [Gammaproteobacteria bacterium]|nr:biopolymer transporter ExbD [Gammaproteobacteria bacterium]